MLEQIAELHKQIARAKRAGDYILTKQLEAAKSELYWAQAPVRK